MTQVDRIEFNFRNYIMHPRLSDEAVHGYELTRFLSPVSQHLLCGICKYVVKLPYECSVCGILYCKPCVSQRVSRYRSHCQKCGKRLVELRRSLSKVISRLQVQCKHPHCLEVVWLGMLPSHEQHCPFKEIRCARRAACARVGLAKDFLKVTHLLTRNLGLPSFQDQYVCSERCKELLQFQSCLVNQDKAAVLHAYQTTLLKLARKSASS